MLSEHLLHRLEPMTGRVRAVVPLGGGCIANASRIDAERGRFFLKWGATDVARTFEAEAAGLSALAAAGSELVIPGVIGFETGKEGFLLMDWVESGRADSGFWETFGRALAGLHRHTDSSYGFSMDNFIGRTPQYNGRAASWPAFFLEYRLEPQRSMARQAGLWQTSWDAGFEELSRRLNELLPGTPPASMLHGDLWSGNFLATSTGAAALIDPAAYYGHHEADLAMTELFGGFDSRFYGAYREAMPLDEGYPERRDIYNLYHLINHLNLFGGSYGGAVRRILGRYR